MQKPALRIPAALVVGGVALAGTIGMTADCNDSAYLVPAACLDTFETDDAAALALDDGQAYAIDPHGPGDATQYTLELYSDAGPDGTCPDGAVYIPPYTVYS